MACQRYTRSALGLLLPLLACLLLPPSTLGRRTQRSATSDPEPWGSGSDPYLASARRRGALSDDGVVPTVYQENLASEDLISQRLNQNETSAVLLGNVAPRAAAAAAATSGVRQAAASRGKQLVPASGVISLCLSQGERQTVCSARHCPVV